MAAFTGAQSISAALSGSSDLIARLERMWPTLLAGIAHARDHPRRHGRPRTTELCHPAHLRTEGDRRRVSRGTLSAGFEGCIEVTDTVDTVLEQVADRARGGRQLSLSSPQRAAV